MNKREITVDNFFSYHCGCMIRKIRKSKGITGSELASRLCLSQQQISRYELGVNKFTMDLLFDVCIVLDINFEQLIKDLFDEIRRNDSKSAVELKKKMVNLDTHYFY
ncbi:TPA: helix-turn-helix domain-containing protein [Providencia rettgeri]